MPCQIEAPEADIRSYVEENPGTRFAPDERALGSIIEVREEPETVVDALNRIEIHLRSENIDCGTLEAKKLVDRRKQAWGDRSYITHVRRQKADSTQQEFQQLLSS
ncbi:hypothetical protein JVX88_27375 [Leptolyngbya sp. 7M]|nr:hypothetical protein [Leptolyngbya sp. 7M]QYO68903.1 hypothetical protein JVX88_27375 [Leptolyngbya sp. 7M]